jgi:hypothetical protein
MKSCNIELLILQAKNMHGAMDQFCKLQSSHMMSIQILQSLY